MRQVRRLLLCSAILLGLAVPVVGQETLNVNGINIGATQTPIRQAAGRITISGANIVVEPGSTGITTVGTLTTGVWNAGAVTSNGILTGTSSFNLAGTANLNSAANVGLTLAVTGASNLTGVVNVGTDVMPVLNYTSNLGSISRKYLTLHAAELWVETLVAQDTIATIGGRVLVGPTTYLIADIAPNATTINVKHNQMQNGHRAYMEAAGKLEWYAITSAATAVTGGFQYSVTRDLDGSGANEWYAGDAMFNTGTIGNGFIDLHSLAGVRSGTGPTIAGNVRTGTAYNATETRWAIGNLRNLYDYGAVDVYGAAFGDNSAAWVKIDPTSGIRIGHNATTSFQVDAAGNATFAGQVTIGTGRNQLSNSLGSPIVRLATPDGDGTDWGQVFATHGLAVSSGANYPVTFRLENGAGTPTNGSVWMNPQGTPAANSATVWYGPRLPVQTGQRYEWSFYGGVHRAGNLIARMEWFDNAGNSLGASDATGTSIVTATTAGGPTLAQWGRGGVVATAPAGATQVSPQALQIHTAEVDPYTFLIRLFFGEAQPGQTTISPWAPGGQTLITGDSLATDLVSTSTIRSPGATSLTTGTGFILDATGTPVFRVGNPAGNYFKWDGANLSFGQSTVTIDSTGIRLEPDTAAGNYVPINAYRFTTVAGTDLGMSAHILSGISHTLYLHATTDSTARDGLISILASTPSSVSGINQASIALVSNSSQSEIALVTRKNGVLRGGEIRLSGIPDFRGATSGSAGGISGYINILVDGVSYRLAIYNP